RKPLTGVDQLGRDVEADGPRRSPSSRNGRIAGAAGDVEHDVLGLDACPVNRGLTDLRDLLRRLRKVARGPKGARRLLRFSQLSHLGHVSPDLGLVGRTVSHCPYELQALLASVTNARWRRHRIAPASAAARKSQRRRTGPRPPRSPAGGRSRGTRTPG